MKYIVAAVMLGLITSVIVACLFMPRSEEAARSRAIDELSYICTDMNFDCRRFIGPTLLKHEDGVRFYIWKDSSSPKEVTIVRIPDARIGDLTFGLIGKDVTVGSVPYDDSQED